MRIYSVSFHFIGAILRLDHISKIYNPIKLDFSKCLFGDCETEESPNKSMTFHHLNVNTAVMGKSPLVKMM